MKIFLSEFVCGGGWPDGPLPPSLAAEGYAMLLAAAEDLTRDGDLRVVTTWDHRLSPPRWPSGVDARTVRGQCEEAVLSRESARDADAVWVIAPECDDILARRVEELGTSGASHNCSARAIRLCADKLHLAKWLENYGIPTPGTVEASPAATVSATGWRESSLDGESPLPWPIVVKPRDGAGSQSTFVVSGPGVLPPPLLGWETVTALMAADPWPNGWIVQPFVAGRALSVAAIVRSPEDFDLLPAGEQHLSCDGRLTYRGGTVPARDCPATALESLVAGVIHRMPGLLGWIGFDLLVPDDPESPPLLIEINPRLTTSYIGYRALTEENLARRIVRGHSNGGGAEPFDLIAWSGRVRFQADGTVQPVN